MGRDSGSNSDIATFLVAVATFLLAEAVVRSAGVYRAQAAVMLFGVLVPWVVSIIDMSRVFGLLLRGYSRGVSFAVTGLAFVPGLFRFRLLDLTPVAWATVVERIDDPVIVIDARGRIVVLNPAAQRLIGRPLSRGSGRRGDPGVCRAGRRWPIGWIGSRNTARRASS